jgi:outer membrane murein-binding lipoprotein Lpp
MNDQERRIIERLGIEIELEELEEIEVESNFISKLTLLSVVALHRKVDKLMADVTGLEAAVEALATAEGAAVTELGALKDEIAQLTAGGTISQEQIDAITNKVTDVATALTSAATDAAGTGEATPEGGGEEAPGGQGGAEAPAGGGE